MNGRRAWRKRRRKLGCLTSATFLRRHQGRVELCDYGTPGDCPPRPWTARSLVGASMGARKRRAWAEAEATQLTEQERKAGIYLYPVRLRNRSARFGYRIGESLRPCRGCPGCKRCWVCGKSAACFGRYEGHGPMGYACDDCCGHGCEDGHCDPIAGTLHGPGEPCDGSGLLPARKAKR